MGFVVTLDVQILFTVDNPFTGRWMLILTSDGSTALPGERHSIEGHYLYVSASSHLQV